MTERRPSASRGIRRERTPFEWSLLLISLAVTTAVVVGLVLSGLARLRGPADLRVTIADADEPASGGRPLELTVTNNGGSSAENVIIEVTVGDITRELNLDLVAKSDTETATVVVPVDATGPAHADVVSYTNP